MTPIDALIELLERMGANNGTVVSVSEEELSQWPATAVSAMKAQKLLSKARQAVSVLCPGCERECVMPVQTVTGAPRSAASFIVCDKRSDINRVPVKAERLRQWRCDADAIRAFLASSLGLRLSNQVEVSHGIRKIGMVAGEKRSQMLSLRTAGDLSLIVGDSAIPLSEVLRYRDGEYSVDQPSISRLADSSNNADPRYAPNTTRREARKLDTQAKYADWQRAYRDLKKRKKGMSDVWYSKEIAKLDISGGRDAETIRKHMRK
jgi:hypothetical protein